MNDLSLQEISKLSSKADRLLWNSYHCSKNKKFDQLKSTMIFAPDPQNPQKQLRVSEQEARVLFIETLRNSSFLYSIETPTQEKYKWTGENETKASFDLSLYTAKGKPCLNIEFKSGGVSEKAKSKLKIWKDFKKLLTDPGDGMWFHLLKSVDNETLKKILGTIRRDVSSLLTPSRKNKKSKILIFHICILQHGFSLHKVLDLTNPKVDEEYLNDFFDIKYKVDRESLISFNKRNGWTIRKM